MSKKTKKRKLRARRNKANHGKKPRAPASSSHVAVTSRAAPRSSQRALFCTAARGASSRADTTICAIVVRASSARHASSAARNARLIPHRLVYSRAGTADGPRRRISLQRNAGSSPSIASTTSSSVTSVAGAPIGSRRAAPSPSRARPRAERLQVLGQVGRGHAVVLRELGRGEGPVGREDREDRAGVHAPLDTVGEPHIPDTLYPLFVAPIPCPPRWRPSTKSSSCPMPTSTSCSRRRSNG